MKHVAQRGLKSFVMFKTLQALERSGIVLNDLNGLNNLNTGAGEAKSCDCTSRLDFSW